ncbi:EAL domain-containing protein [Bacillus tuaregi]|uniref:EAL domain-containing protein n=1 Tax=Bacillus tuaregi TaxID=1816695 RepID=UPI0008F83444|nr:EAL domain-containing protein [Bacillus tuaregi]
MLQIVDKTSIVRASKQLCKQSGLDPTVIPKSKCIPDYVLEEKLKSYEEILSVARFFMDQFLDSIKGKGIPLLISVSNDEGVILQIDGDQSIREIMNNSGFRVGVQFIEEMSGTNVVNLALKYRRPIEIIGDEHYHHYFYQAACYSVPFTYQEQGTLLGTISIMTSIEYNHPFFLAMLQTMVDSIERELQLRKQNGRLEVLNHILIDTTRNGVVATDTNGIVLEYNLIAEKIIKSRKKDVIGKSISLLTNINSYIDQVLKEEKKFEDIQLSFIDMETNKNIVCLFDALPIYDQKENLIGALGQFRDITERFETEQKIQYMAHHDELTGLANRRLFKHQYLKEIKLAHDSGEKLAIVFIDLDRFKYVNDTFGHSEGDILLQQVSHRLKECLVTERDLVARMGGDEFIFILPEKENSESIQSHAERILSCFDQPFMVSGFDIHISASLGIAIFPDNGKEFDSLMICADSAMYQAKAKGGNNFQIFEHKMYTNSHKRLFMENALRKAIEKNELYLEYQPQMDAKNGRLLGVEALVRWNHPQLGFVSPTEFIPLSEETGIIIPLGEWVLREACKQNKRWQTTGYPPIIVSVNLSGKQFSQHGLVNDISQILNETGLEPEYLDIEITESMMMDVNHSIHILEELCRLGVQISIDDFGTGYSSLNYLTRFSLDRLKIDRSFVQNITNSVSDASIVETIIVMAHNLGLRVIAEGVESVKQLEFLTEKNCDEFQGYFFSKPLSAEKLEQEFLQGN